MQVAYGLGTELICAWTSTLTQSPLPPNYIHSHFDRPTPSPLSANVITECLQTSLQIFSYKFFSTNLSKVKLEIPWNSSTIFRSNHWMCSIKMLFLKILQYSQKTAYVGLFFLVILKLPVKGTFSYKKTPCNSSWKTKWSLSSYFLFTTCSSVHIWKIEKVLQRSRWLFLLIIAFSVILFVSTFTNKLYLNQ